MAYAYARKLDPQTGDWTYSAATTFAQADSPALELVKRILRTLRGSSLLDPQMGVDWQKVDPLGTQAQATTESVLRAALDPLVRRGAIADLVFRVEVDSRAGRVLYEVDFTDVRARQRRTASGSA